MSIRNQLFRSNMLVVVTAILLLLISIAVIIGVLRVSYDSEWQGMKNLDEQLYDIQTALGELDLETDSVDEQLSGLMSSLQLYGYDLYVRKDGKLYMSNLSKQELVVVQALDFEQLRTVHESVRVAQSRNRTVVYRLILLNGERYDLCAISEKSSLKMETFDLVQMFVLSFAALLSISVAIIFLLSRYFSHRMVDRFMIPISKLVDGAGRVQKGDLSEMIYYSEENEFSTICNSFNDMQRSLSRERERSRAYEQSRVEMIAGISHDLRTPLTSLQGYLKGVLDGVANTPEKRERYLRVAYEKAADIDILLSKLFLFSKLETGNMPYDFQLIELHQFLEHFVRQEREEYGDQIAGLSYENYAPDVIVELDADQMRRVLENVIQNSVKYKKDGPPMITVEVYRAGQDIVFLSISDDGSGVDQRDLPHIFENYYRGGENKSCAMEGSGLGLSIVRYIVEAHHGSVRAESNDGLEIIISLPIKSRVKQREESEADHEKSVDC